MFGDTTRIDPAQIRFTACRPSLLTWRLAEYDTVPASTIMLRKSLDTPDWLRPTMLSREHHANR